MKIRGANNIQKLGAGIMLGGVVLGLGLGISASVLYGLFDFTPSVIGLLSASGTAFVLGGGIGYAVVLKSDDLHYKHMEAIKRVRMYLSKEGENL